MHLHLRDIAAILGVSEHTVHRWIQDDRLPNVEVNGQGRSQPTNPRERVTVRQAEIVPTSAPRDGLAEALQRGGVIFDLPGSTRDAVLAGVVGHLSLPSRFDRMELLQLFLARESAGSTGVGNGIAIPHPRVPVTLPPSIGPSLTLFYLDQPVDFDAADRRKVEILFVLMSPTIRSHLHMLAKLASAIRHEPFRDALANRPGQAEVLQWIRLLESTVIQGPNGRSRESA